MKNRIFYLFIFVFSTALFLLLIFLSSPYRELRPYNIFGYKIPENLNKEIRYINNRKTILISVNNSEEKFYIDQNLVTISNYKNCLESGGCQTEHYRDFYTNIYENSFFNIFPVTFITWMEARTFCNNYGGDLPTAKQWELAAGSEYKYDYPWGNALPSIAKANVDGFYQWLTPAGWLPEGASPYGVLDMSGNVREWVLDEVIDENDNKLLKGGGSNDSYSDCRNESAFTHAPTSSGFNRGFRCVYPVN